jgi:hypothetical protein
MDNNPQNKEPTDFKVRHNLPLPLILLLFIFLLLGTFFWLQNKDLVDSQLSRLSQMIRTGKLSAPPDTINTGDTTNITEKSTSTTTSTPPKDNQTTTFENLIVKGALSVEGSSTLQRLDATDATFSSLTILDGPVTLPFGSIPNSALANSSLTYIAGSGLTGGGAVSLGGTATLNIGAGRGILVWDNDIEVVYGDQPFTAVEGNKELIIVTNSNLTGGKNITLGNGGTFELGIVSNPTFSTSVTTPLLNLTNSGFTTSFQTATLTDNQTINLPNASGDVCLTIGNCAGLGGTISGAGTTNRIAKFTSSSGISDSSINDLATALAMTIDASGNVGIGTTGPTSRLTIDMAGTNGGIRLQNAIQTRIDFETTQAGSANWNILNMGNINQFAIRQTGNGAGTFVIEGNAPTGSLYINSSGNVGIGTTTPTSFKLEVAGSVGPSVDNTYDLGSAIRRWANIYGTTINATTVNATNLTGTVTPSGFTQGSVIFAGSGGTLTQDNPNFFWDDTNNRLGLGTTTPTQPLHIIGSNGGIVMERDTAATNANFLSLYNTNTTDGNMNTIQFRTLTTGAGAANRAIAHIKAINVTHNDATRTGDLYFDVSAAGLGPTTRMMIQGSSGNVGIGTTAPDATLTVSKNVTSAPGSLPVGVVAHFIQSDSTAHRLVMDSYGSGNSILMRRANGTAASPSVVLNGDILGQIGAGGWSSESNYSATGRAQVIFTAAENWEHNKAGTHITFSTTAIGGVGSVVERMRIHADGNVGIGTTTPSSFKLEIAGSIGPSANLTYDLGSASRRWNNIYANNINTSGNLTLTGHLLPAADDTYDLGSPTFRWRDLYLGPTSLHIQSTAAETTTARDWTLGIQETDGASEGNLRLSLGGADFMNITPTGNVGIGTTAPGARLDVDGAALTVTASSQRAIINNTNAITTNTGATDVFSLRINEPNITVGTATPTNSASLYIASAATEATNNYALWIDSGTARFDGDVQVSGALSVGSQQTLTADSTTPSVAAGSHWISANTVSTTISNFTNGTNGQIIYVEVNDANTILDCTASNLSCGGTDITPAAGDLFSFIYDGTNWNLINWVDTSATQTGADIAEYYVSDEELTAGEVVSIAPEGNTQIEKTRISADPATIGIIATQPYLIMGDKTLNTYPVALIGRVPVKVSSSSAAIKPGDYITSSDESGRATKATKAGQMIGKALEAWDPASGSDTVMVFVNTIYADPGQTLASLKFDEYGNLILPFNEEKEVKALRVDHASEPKRDLGWTLADIVRRLEKLEDGSASSPQGSGSASSPQGSGSATLSATDSTRLEVLTGKVDSNTSEIDILKSSILDLKSKTASLEAELVTYSLALITNTASSAAELSLESLDATDMTISNNLSVGGRTTLSDIGVTGAMNIGLLSIEGLSENGFATLNTSAGPLKIQSDGINGIDILNGKIVIEPNGNMKVDGTVTVKKLNVDTEEVASASLGEAILPVGDTKVTINTTSVTEESKIFVTPKTKSSLPLSVTGQENGTSFTVELALPADKDIKFNWWIIN